MRAAVLDEMPKNDAQTHIPKKRETKEQRKEGRNEEASGGVFGAGCGKWGRGDGKKRKRWFFWALGRGVGGGGRMEEEEGERKEGRKKNCCSFIAVAVAPVRPPPKKRLLPAAVPTDRQNPKKGVHPEMGLAPESGFTLYPSFLSSLLRPAGGGDAPPAPCL